MRTRFATRVGILLSVRRRRLGMVLGVFGVSLILAGFAVGRWTRVRWVSVPAPVAEPVRIAVLGDFHLVDEASLRHARACLQTAMAQQPDMVVLVGDYVHTHHGLPYLRRALQGAHAPLGVYAVLGNHDHWSGKDAVIRALREAGVVVLCEENRTVRKGNTRLTLVGIYDLLCHKPRWERAFRGVPAVPDHPVILLSHNPDAVLSPYRDRTTLIVSGHTHAGQVWAPTTAHRAMQRLFGRSYIPKTRYGTANPYGLYQEGDTYIYITSGVTHGRAIPRWYTRPEVSIIELTPAQSRH